MVFQIKPQEEKEMLYSKQIKETVSELKKIKNPSNDVKNLICDGEAILTLKKDLNKQFLNIMIDDRLKDESKVVLNCFALGLLSGPLNIWNEVVEFYGIKDAIKHSFINKDICTQTSWKDTWDLISGKVAHDLTEPKKIALKEMYNALEKFSFSLKKLEIAHLKFADAILKNDTKRINETGKSYDYAYENVGQCLKEMKTIQEKYPENLKLMNEFLDVCNNFWVRGIITAGLGLCGPAIFSKVPVPKIVPPKIIKVGKIITTQFTPKNIAINTGFALAFNNAKTRDTMVEWLGNKATFDQFIDSVTKGWLEITGGMIVFNLAVGPAVKILKFSSNSILEGAYGKFGKERVCKTFLVNFTTKLDEIVRMLNGAEIEDIVSKLYRIGLNPKITQKEVHKILPEITPETAGKIATYIKDEWKFALQIIKEQDLKKIGATTKQIGTASKEFVYRLHNAVGIDLNMFSPWVRKGIFTGEICLLPGGYLLNSHIKLKKLYEELEKAKSDYEIKITKLLFPEYAPSSTIDKDGLRKELKLNENQEPVKYLANAIRELVSPSIAEKFEKLSSEQREQLWGFSDKYLKICDSLTTIGTLIGK